ncbi:MAG: 4Fe-4S dicluster domain-containing protein, partial [Clostridia bacterium]|nr:4Fe-4S dicluster domain-containing protein [Clostridia bacterium]
QETLNAVLKELLAVDTIDCTACGYCLKSCPQNVKIPIGFDLLNNAKITGNKKFFKEQYTWQMSGGLASACIECGTCVSMCPQKINIPSELKKVTQYFE